MSNISDTAKNRDFRDEVDNLLEKLISEFYKTVPFAEHQSKSENINLDYYKRHNIETILRLRLKRTIDALTIHYFTKVEPKFAKMWANYTDDEMLHDKWFAKDLNKVGVSNSEIYSTEPFFSTKLLQGYFYYGLEHEGKPLASLCSSYLIEYVTQATQSQWLDNLGKALGEDKVKGHRAHVNHDLEDDHLDFVWKVLSSFIETEKDKDKIKQHMQNVYQLFCAYFVELHEATIENSPDRDSKKLVHELVNVS